MMHLQHIHSAVILGLCALLAAPAGAAEAAQRAAQGAAQGAAQRAAQGAAQKAAEKPPQTAQSPAGVLRLDQTVISGNQELPKVLYILPWREPQGLPEIEIQAEFTEAEVFRRLYPPAYRRELGYFETLAGLKETELKENSDPAQEK